MGKNSENNKRIAKNTVFLYFRSLFVLFVNLFASRIILDTLGVKDYGVYNVVGGIVTMFSVLSGTLASATQRFITFALGQGDEQKVKSIFTHSLILHAILAVFISLLLEIAGVWMFDSYLDIPPERVNAARFVLHFSIGAFFVNMVSVPYNALITAYEKMKAFAYIGILECMLKFGAALYLYVCRFDKLITYALLIMFISVSIRIVYSIYCHRNFTASQNIKLKFESKLFKEMLTFAGWNLFGNGSLALRNQGVDIILNMFFGVTVNAAKGLSNQIQNGVMLLVQNFQTAASPQLTKAIAQNDKERTYTLINQGSRFSFFLLTIIAVPIIISAPEILNIWLKIVPNYTVEFVQWTMIYLLLDTQSRFLIYAILSTGKIRNYQIIVGCTKLLAIPLVLLFLKCNETYWNCNYAALIGIAVNIFLEIICFAERLFFNKRQLQFPSRLFLKKIFLTNWIVFFTALVLSVSFSEFLTKNIFVVIPFSIATTFFCIAFIGMNSIERLKVLEKSKQTFITYIASRNSK
ncbi:MAG: hypothetical protein MJY93_05700 [Fibrobacter sp.]|nr:hypothetical protein [Fibrobacter sp.]